MIGISDDNSFSEYDGDEDFYCYQCDSTKSIGENEDGFKYLYCEKCLEAEEEYYMSKWTDATPKSF